MKHHFECPINPNLAGEYSAALVVDWDDETGEVSGPGAETVLELARGGVVDAGPHPRVGWPVSESWLVDPECIAAIVGHAWIVPEYLLQHYPDTVEDLDLVELAEDQLGMLN